MKRTLLPLALLMGTLQLNAQVVRTAGFENLTIPADSFINGSKGDTLISEAGFGFPIYWNPDWSFWEGGWAASNQTDSTRTSTDGMYQSITGSGNASANYLIGQFGSSIPVDNDSSFVMDKVFITNTSFVYSTLRDGDNFSKKFGGPTGTDPDYFRLLILGRKLGTWMDDTVTVYLADFRSSNPSEDYILGNWEMVNLASLADADTLVFSMESSDTGQFGMNTPLFFALDDLSHVQYQVAVPGVERPVLGTYPNPAETYLTIHGPEEAWEILDIRGSRVMAGEGTYVNLQTLPSGMYFLQNASGLTNRFIKR